MIFVDPISIFHCATPRGVIRWDTFWANLPQIALLVDAILRRIGRLLPQMSNTTSGLDVRDGVALFYQTQVCLGSYLWVRLSETEHN